MENMNPNPNADEGRCAVVYCEGEVWVSLVVRGEVEDSGLEVGRVVSKPEGRGTVIREGCCGFCREHAQALYGGKDRRGKVVVEGISACSICGAEGTPVVWFMGGGDEAGGTGRACVLCCAERGIC